MKNQHPDGERAAHFDVVVLEGMEKYLAGAIYHLFIYHS
jgi:hypothetical protein